MKKALALLLSALMLTACFTACDGANNTNDDDDKDKEKTTQNDSGKNDSDVDDSVKMVRGSIDGNVYSSDFSGITFTKPDSWVYSSDEEIAATMDATVDMFKDENYAEAIKNTQTVIEMMVVDNNTGTNMNITYENLAMSNSQDITEEKYLDVTLDTLASQTTMELELSDEADVTLCGAKYHRAIFNVSYSGIELQQVYYLRKIDNYMVNVVVTLVSGYSIEDIETMFS